MLCLACIRVVCRQALSDRRCTRYVLLCFLCQCIMIRHLPLCWSVCHAAYYIRTTCVMRLAISFALHDFSCPLLGLCVCQRSWMSLVSSIMTGPLTSWSTCLSPTNSSHTQRSSHTHHTDCSHSTDRDNDVCCSGSPSRPYRVVLM